MNKKEASKFYKRWIALLCAIILFAMDTTAYAASIDNDPQYARGSAQASQVVTDSRDDEIDNVGASGLVAGGNYSHDSRFGNYTVRNMIDVSKWQGNIDWNKVKASGIDYAIIRAGYRGSANGVLVTDPYFETNIKNATAAGVKVGVYIFSQAITTAEAKKEAEFLIKKVKGYKISLPLVMDYEFAPANTGRLYAAHLSKSKASSIANAFCAKVKSAGYTPMLYANKDYLMNSMNASTVSSKYKIWLARYNSTAQYTGTYEYWQYSSNGRVDGISTAVDVNFWYDDSTLKAPAKTKITYLKSTSKKKVTIKWKKVSSVSGYQISYSTNKNYKNAKTKNITSGTKYTFKNLKSGKTYYFRIRVYNQKLNGKKVYSKYVTKTVKIK